MSDISINPAILHQAAKLPDGSDAITDGLGLSAKAAEVVA